MEEFVMSVMTLSLSKNDVFFATNTMARSFLLKIKKKKVTLI